MKLISKEILQTRGSWVGNRGPPRGSENSGTGREDIHPHVGVQMVYYVRQEVACKGRTCST